VQIARALFEMVVPFFETVTPTNIVYNRVFGILFLIENFVWPAMLRVAPAGRIFQSDI
jgi:hypothetical protein